MVLPERCKTGFLHGHEANDIKMNKFTHKRYLNIKWFCFYWEISNDNRDFQ
jgi:hypothetical protein